MYGHQLSLIIATVNDAGTWLAVPTHSLSPQVRLGCNGWIKDPVLCQPWELPLVTLTPPTEDTAWMAGR